MIKPTNNVEEAELDDNPAGKIIEKAPEPPVNEPKKEFNSSVNDFISNMSKPTNTGALAEDKKPESQKRPEVKLDDFDGAAADDIKSPTEQPVTGQELKKKASSLSNQTQAKIYTQLLDSTVFGIGFTAGYKWKYNKKVGKSNLENAFNFIYSVESLCKPDLSDYQEIYTRKLAELDESMKTYVYHASKMRDKLDKVKMNSDEKKDLIDSLSDIIAENDGKMPAWLGVTITLLAIATPRISDIILD